MKLSTSLNDLAAKLRENGQHSMLSYLSSLPIAVLRSLDTEANRFYDRKVQVGKDQEKAQSEKDSHSKNRGGKKTN